MTELLITPILIITRSNLKQFILLFAHTLLDVVDQFSHLVIYLKS
jgi:hypothetical protein